MDIANILSTYYYSRISLTFKLTILAFCLGIEQNAVSQDAAVPEQKPASTDFWLPTMPEPADQTEQTDEMKLTDPELVEPEKQDEPVVIVDGGPQGHVFNKWKFIPYATLQTTYDDNVFISSQNRRSDLYFTFEPGMAVGWGAVRRDSSESGGYFRHVDTPKVEINPTEEGNYVLANYTLSRSLFTKITSQDSTNHDVSLSGEWRLEKFLFAARVRYQTLSDTDIDVGTRVNHSVLSASISTQYSISEKTSLEADFARTTNSYQNNLVLTSTSSQTVLGSTDTSNQDWINYQATQKINIGLGVKAGILEVDNSPDQTYQQFLMRSAYNTGKLSFSASGGVEVRQIEKGERVDPVFTVGATYAPTDQTTLYLEAFRQTFSSATVAGEDIATTGVTARIRQRCFEKVYLSLSGGYQRGEYVETVQATSSNRIDGSLFFKAGVSFDFTKWVNMELAYEYRDNQSTLSSSSFRQNLVTLQMNVFF